LGLRDPYRDILREHTKASLLIAKWIGLPLGWILCLMCGTIYLTFGIHDDMVPSPILVLIPVGLLIMAVGLGVSHRAVTRELRKRQDEPSQFWRTLGRMILLIVIGLFASSGIFLGTEFALSRTTSMSVERTMYICAWTSLAFLLIAFFILARRWTISVTRNASVEDGQTPDKANVAGKERG
jgi:hypothetical protein